MLAFVLLIGVAGLLGALSSGLSVSLVGSVLVLVAFVEAGVILAGFLAFQPQQTPAEKPETE
jgi:hypothetical protein